VNTPPVVLFPDAEAAIVTHLLGVLDSGVRVGTDWPENLAEHLPVVAVTRGGGATHLRLVLDEPTLDIDVLAETKAQAHDLVQTVRGELFATEGTVMSGTLSVSRVQDTSLIWLPDPTTGIPRYVLVMSMRVRPL
jgi:hypothetical protein